MSARAARLVAAELKRRKGACHPTEAYHAVIEGLLQEREMAQSTTDALRLAIGASVDATVYPCERTDWNARRCWRGLLAAHQARIIGTKGARPMSAFDPRGAWQKFLDTEDGRYILCVSKQLINRFARTFDAGYMAAPRADGRSFWVVERIKDGRGAGYWDGGSSDSFVTNIDAAIQFCRQSDAFWATRGWHANGTKITEHMMLPGASASEEAIPR